MKLAATLTLLAAALTLSGVGHPQHNRDSEKVAYLAAYMKNDDERHLYYALSDGSSFVFRALNGGKPVLGAHCDDGLIRDPMILQDRDGVYHLVATVSWTHRPFVIWDSADLVNWEDERLVDVAPEGASKTWAPELFYDDKKDDYFAFWTAEIYNDWPTAAIYYSTTKDFRQWSAPALLHNDDDGILDANIIKTGDIYRLLYRKNGVWVATSSNAAGPYGDIRLLSDENVEGPFAFPLLDGGYGIVWDYFRDGGGFGLMVSRDFVQWKKLTNERGQLYNDSVVFPEGIRHGAIFGVTRAERDRLLEAFPY